MIKTLTSQPNFTIIVNWKAKGFGCAKACSYCNWRLSPLLPQGSQSPDAISSFIHQCKKRFITISGGGDPLYRFEENQSSLIAMATTIKNHGFKVRLITREVQYIEQLKGIADYASISLDADVLSNVDRYKGQWDGIDIEYSIVLPPLPQEKLLTLKPQYMALRSRLGKRLALRENFNSVFPLNPKAMSFGHTGIVFVPKSLCLDSRYLSTIDCDGHSIVQDNAALARVLMQHPNVFIFGGFAKHLLDPVVHLEYDDIDLIATDPAVMKTLTNQFDYSFKETSPPGSYPRYYQGKSIRAGKSIQLILMESAKDANSFIFNAQYTVDRFGYSQGFFFDASLGEQAIRHAVTTKSAKAVLGPRSLRLYSKDRHQIEQRHKVKLLKKGFVVTA